MTCVVRSEVAADVPAIFAVHCVCFPSDAEAKLVDALRAAGRLQISLVAVAGEQVVGHVAFSPVTTASGPIGLGLGPIAVLPAHRCQGVGAHLVKSGLLACQAAGYGWAVVLGDPAYYSRFGFRPASSFGLRDEFDGGTHFQAIELADGQLPVGAGVARYAPEFNSLA